MHEKEKNLNRSQRCGQCNGCSAKPCGLCVYCQDSPQFGGPGVKKQSCLERRCYRVLENRLQRDGPGFKAKLGCSACEECAVADCLTCLVCLDKKFFENRYLPGAMCAKKRCTQARSLEFPFPNSVPPAMNADLDYLQSPSPRPNGNHASDGVFSPLFQNPSLTVTPNGKRHSPSSKSDEKTAKSRKKRSMGTNAVSSASNPQSTANNSAIPGQPTTLAAVAITHHPILQVQNPGYDHLVTNSMTITSGQPQGAAAPQFSQLTAVPAQGMVPIPAQSFAQNAFNSYRIPSRGGELNQASTQFETRTLLNGGTSGASNQSLALPQQIQIQSFNGLVQNSLKHVLPESASAMTTNMNGSPTSTSVAQTTVIPTFERPSYINGNNATSMHSNGHLYHSPNFHAPTTAMLNTKADDQNGLGHLHPFNSHNEMTVLTPAGLHQQYRPLPAEAVTHLCPTTFGQSGLAAFHGDNFCTDPATMIPPSFSGSHQVVLQPL